METLLVVFLLIVVALPIYLFARMENKRISDLHERKFERAERNELANQVKESEIVKTTFANALEEAKNKQKVEELNKQYEEDVEASRRDFERKRRIERDKEIERQRVVTRNRESERKRQETNNSFYDNTASNTIHSNSSFSASDDCSPSYSSSSSSSSSDSSYDSSSSSSSSSDSSSSSSSSCDW